MVVVPHEAIGVTNPVASMDDFIKGIDKLLPICILVEDGHLPDATAYDMV